MEDLQEQVKKIQSKLTFFSDFIDVWTTTTPQITKRIAELSDNIKMVATHSAGQKSNIQKNTLMLSMLYQQILAIEQSLSRGQKRKFDDDVEKVLADLDQAIERLPVADSNSPGTSSAFGNPMDVPILPDVVDPVLPILPASTSASAVLRSTLTAKDHTPTKKENS